MTLDGTLQQPWEMTRELLAEKKREYNDLLDLYLSSKMRREVLDARAQALDTQINSLENTQRELAARLEAATLTADKAAILEEFAEEVRKRLDHADNDFAKRRWAIETLNARATLTQEEGQQVLDAKCIIDARVVAINGNPTA